MLSDVEKMARIIEGIMDEVGERSVDRFELSDADLLQAAATAAGQMVVADAIRESGVSLCSHIEACRMTYAAPDGGIIPTKG